MLLEKLFLKNKEQTPMHLLDFFFLNDVLEIHAVSQKVFVTSNSITETL